MAILSPKKAVTSPPCDCDCIVDDSIELNIQEVLYGMNNERYLYNMAVIRFELERHKVHYSTECNQLILR